MAEPRGMDAAEKAVESLKGFRWRLHQIMQGNKGYQVLLEQRVRLLEEMIGRIGDACSETDRA